ncbi:MAG: transposase, partial [Burkholderiales bacterium]|nr:transposase [Burkholderiales bacterium]
ARAVWYEFFDHKKQAWSQRRLLLATELQLEPAQVMHFYSLRWGIESLFQNLKRWWGANKSLAAIAARPRAVDASAIHRLRVDAAARVASARGLPVQRGGPVAKARGRRHRGTVRRLDAAAFLRRCVSPRL